MLIALGCTAYVFVAVVLARPLAGDWAWRMYEAGQRSYPVTRRGQVRPFASQWIGSGLMAFAVTLIWPLAGVAALAWRLGGSRPMGRERDALLKEREQRIADLEKELELR